MAIAADATNNEPAQRSLRNGRRLAHFLLPQPIC
jgi:hypothetical protein